MPISITMPRLSDTMEEGTLVKWNVKVGDAISAGDHLADVETDKATMELESFDDGTLALIATAEGAAAAVGDLIAVLAEEGESIEEAAKAAQDSAGAAPASAQSTESKTPVAAAAAAGGDDSGGDDSGGGVAVAQPPAKTSAPPPPAAPPPSPAPPTAPTGRRIRISPLAQKLADEFGLDVAAITPSGPGGRIIKRDVLAARDGGGRAASTASPAPAAAPRDAMPSLAIKPLTEQILPVSNMRKTIARVLVESKNTAPHFQVTVNVNADPMLEARAQVNRVLEAQGTKLSVNDFIVRATTIALTHHPAVNSSWTDEGIKQHGTVNMGIAVALPAEKGGGLVVPTLRDCQSMSLSTISSETRRLAKKARTQGLTIDEMSDGTFTISNLGMYGVEHFTAIINPPQCAILAVGGANEKVVVRDGDLAIGHDMSLTLSADHRVIDGAMAAEYLVTLKNLLENPAGMLV